MKVSTQWRRTLYLRRPWKWDLPLLNKQLLLQGGLTLNWLQPITPPNSPQRNKVFLHPLIIRRAYGIRMSNAKPPEWARQRLQEELKEHEKTLPQQIQQQEQQQQQHNKNQQQEEEEQGHEQDERHNEGLNENISEAQKVQLSTETNIREQSLSFLRQKEREQYQALQNQYEQEVRKESVLDPNEAPLDWITAVRELSSRITAKPVQQFHTEAVQTPNRPPVEVEGVGGGSGGGGRGGSVTGGRGGGEGGGERGGVAEKRDSDRGRDRDALTFRQFAKLPKLKQPKSRPFIEETRGTITQMDIVQLLERRRLVVNNNNNHNNNNNNNNNNNKSHSSSNTSSNEKGDDIELEKKGKVEVGGEAEEEVKVEEKKMVEEAGNKFGIAQEDLKDVMKFYGSIPELIPADVRSRIKT